MDREVQVWREGRAGRIRLNRPKSFNALNLDMVKTIRAAVDEFGADPTVHVILPVSYTHLAIRRRHPS